MGYNIGKPSRNQGDKFDKAALDGALLLFVGVSLVEAISTSFGESDAAKVNAVVVLDGAHEGDILRNLLIFGTALVPSLTDSGELVLLGRLGKVASKTPGHSPAWVLDDPTDDDEATAQAFLDSVGGIIDTADGPSLSEVVEAP